jgi:hypothetical protein
MARKLDGQVAVVDLERAWIGPAIALALGARGVRVVVTGSNERILGETVGELAHAGAMARHVVGDVAGGADRAHDVFGGLDVVVVDVERLAAMHAVLPRIGEGGRVLALGLTGAEETLAERVGALAPELAARRIAWNALLATATAPADRVAALAVVLCDEGAGAIMGATMTVR